ncbi:DUF3180 domain-containing protein [Agromyces binzhouensis]|uniref:DUF3180 domain-containing protein n=1 Tax=Agromyces binzhouensis TaxID=1817495 RepID=A0A4Q2JFH4_9MICO|nr:DUF3180 domain-containing protein [Agromyces binzhouensis]RXZ45219.1 DUF3180 domain-containing protein [Agromyces binzhouensis]
MNRTHASTLVAFAVVGLAVGYLGELALVAGGATALVPPISLAVTLIGIGAIVVLVAWPIRQAVRGERSRRVDPFRAARIAVLAKASSVTGALVLGVGIGITIFLLTRSVLPPAGTIWMAVATAIGAALLLIGGLVAEHFCTLPPDDPEEEGSAHA